MHKTTAQPFTAPTARNPLVALHKAVWDIATSVTMQKRNWRSVTFKSLHRLCAHRAIHTHTQAWRKTMQCRGSCECLHRSQNSHYWHSCLYPRSTKRGYKNNEVQQAQNKKSISAVNWMECLTQDSVVIFLLPRKCLQTSLNTLKKKDSRPSCKITGLYH